MKFGHLRVHHGHSQKSQFYNQKLIEKHIRSSKKPLEEMKNYIADLITSWLPESPSITAASLSPLLYLSLFFSYALSKLLTGHCRSCLLFLPNIWTFLSTNLRLHWLFTATQQKSRLDSLPRAKYPLSSEAGLREDYKYLSINIIILVTGKKKN